MFWICSFWWNLAPHTDSDSDSHAEVFYLFWGNKAVRIRVKIEVCGGEQGDSLFFLLLKDKCYAFILKEAHLGIFVILDSFNEGKRRKKKDVVGVCAVPPTW